MRLATFTENQHERFGLVLPHPATLTDWVFDPNRVQERLTEYASRGTSPLNANPPDFFGGRAVPSSLAAFLGYGQDGLDKLRRLSDFLSRFLEQADPYILKGASFPVDTVKLNTPIPRPRLFFGLVQNSPTAWRSNPARTHLNLFPQGHQRPQGAVLAPGDPIVLPFAETITGGWNPELGVIIGRGGRDIPVNQAMSHVAGLTIVSDVTFDYFRKDYAAQEPPYDWFEDAMSSWGDKKSDARTPMGPYLVTIDEIGNPYDLLIYTRQSGLMRDRSHTGAMALGIERTIYWLSSLMTLYPGDVIHIGTMGYDGSPYLSAYVPQPDDYIESEIEKLGVLRNPLVIGHSEYDWRDVHDPARTVHPSPAIRGLIAQGQERVNPTEWSVENVRHAWLLFGNYAAAEAQEGLKPRPYPRFLCAPNTILAADNAQVVIPESAGTVWLGCELAFVVSRVARQVHREDADDYILGYLPLLSIYDTAFEDTIIEPASMQERNLPKVYGRWRDGFNVVGGLMTHGETTSAACTVALDGVGSVAGSTAEYLHAAPDVLAYITQFITLFPGDVITLGRLAARLEVPLGTQASGLAEIENLGQVTFHIQDRRNPG